MRYPALAGWTGAALLVLACAAGPAHAAGVVGNGSPASCTEAAFNAALAGGGTVTFNCGGAAGPPVVIPITTTKTLTTTTTIDGTGQAIILDGGGTTRLFRTTYQFASFTLTFRNLTMRNGRAPDYGGAIRLAYQDFLTTLVVENVAFVTNTCDQAGNDVGGGALYAQGGIVTIRNSTFTGNRGGNGGAIGNLQARFTIEDSLFSGNSTNAHVGGAGGNGGAIYIDGSGGGQLVVRRTTFQDNTAAWIGGAFHTYLYAGGTGMTIEDSIFQGNTTYANGGAIYHQNGTLQIARSTFSGNTTRGQGGALWLLQASTVTITNSTFSGNQAIGIPPNNGSSGLGGAILINDQNNVTITHTTIADNHADWVGGGITGGMGGSTTTLRGTIVANNTAANGGNPWNIGQNCNVQLLDGGGNLQYPARNPNDPSDRNCTGSIAIGDPLLGPLAANGGPTPTRAIPAASPARNRVTTGCPPPTTDQRGVARPAGACDSGSYEATAFLGAADVTVNEGSGGSANAVFTVTLSEASTQAVTVAFQTADGTAVSGSDYAPASGTITFPAGTTSRTQAVALVTDTTDENDETFRLVLSNPVGATLGAPGFATATIQDDDDPPTLRAADCTAGEGTGAAGTCALAVDLSAASGKTVVVSYATSDGSATAPGDYAARTGTLTLPPGAASGTIALTFVGDAQDETDETFTLTLSNAQNAAVVDAQGAVTIDDDDGPTLAVTSPSVVEGNAGTVDATFAMTLSAASVQDVIVDYATGNGTAVAGQDYQATSGTVTFVAGLTLRNVVVPVTGDVVDEPNETFYLNLTAVTDATPVSGEPRATIVDDDGTGFALQAVDHGAVRRDTLEGGPDLFVVHQPARTSWEVRVDATSGDVGDGSGPLVQRLAGDLGTVLQSASAIGSGPSRVLRWVNAAAAPQDQYVRVSSTACASDCGPDDVYRLRAYETTGRIPRFNAANGQITVVVLQNATDAPIAYTAYFWNAAGALLDSRSSTVPARGVQTFDSGSLPGTANQSGAITVVHDGGYGGLTGKAVTLDPGGGFSFDTPLAYRPY